MIDQTAADATQPRRFALVGLWVEDEPGKPARLNISTANTPAIAPRPATRYSPAMGGCASAVDLLLASAAARVASGYAITASVRLFNLDEEHAAHVVEIVDGMDAARAAMWDD